MVGLAGKYIRIGYSKEEDIYDTEKIKVSNSSSLSVIIFELRYHLALMEIFLE